jgi:hypothetical protein
MKKNILVLFIIGFLFSCQNKENKTLIKKNKKELNIELSNKVFYISPELNTEQCLAYNDGCDCCDGRIVFLKNGTFISNFYCIPEEIYNTGTFKIVNSKIKLNYSSKSAVLAPKSEDDFDGNNILKLENIKGETTYLDIIKCNEKYVFKSQLDGYFTEDKKTSFKKAISEYKKFGVWKLLDIKE